MNNSIRDYRGNIVGFRCRTCNKIAQSMWGETCNQCRSKEKQSNLLIEDIKKLREEIQQFKNK